MDENTVTPVAMFDEKINGVEMDYSQDDLHHSEDLKDFTSDEEVDPGKIPDSDLLFRKSFFFWF